MTITNGPMADQRGGRSDRAAQVLADIDRHVGGVHAGQDLRQRVAGEEFVVGHPAAHLHDLAVEPRGQSATKTEQPDDETEPVKCE